MSISNVFSGTLIFVRKDFSSKNNNVKWLKATNQKSSTKYCQMSIGNKVNMVMIDIEVKIELELIIEALKF